MESVRLALAKTVSAGAPCRPSASTSQPSRRSTSWRAAASAVTLAMCAPVTNPTLAWSGRPSASRIHRAVQASSADIAGDMTCSAPF